MAFNKESEQYPFAWVLRPGNVSASVGALGILSRLLPKLREACLRARLRLRLDGGFATAPVFEFLERERLEYVVAMGKRQCSRTVCRTGDGPRAASCARVRSDRASL